MKCFQKIITITILFTLFFSPNIVLAVSDSVDIFQEVFLPCNYNDICEPHLDENEISCSADCGCNNNGLCEPLRGENIGNCPLDCALFPRPDGVIPPRIFNLLVSEITLNSAKISWETNKSTLCKFFWGRTSEYKKETISEVNFKKKHSVNLTGLSPATVYYFKVDCQDPLDLKTETDGQKFTTLIPPDTIPPANVSDFRAVPDDKQITLFWENPPDSDFKAVRIVRNEKFYPSSPWDGIPVYDNDGTSFVDTGLKNGNRYYYTAFAYDKTGNYSSGAIVSAVPQPEVPIIVPPLPPEEIPPIVPPLPEIEKITLEDFDFIQKGKKIFLKDKKAVKIEAEEPLTISIDYKKVPEVLKTIMVTLKKEEKSFSFLLRVNKEKTAYKATLLSPPEAGIYPFIVTILDYKNQTLKKINGELLIIGKAGVAPIAPILWYQKIPIWKYIIYVLPWIFLLLLIAHFFKKREKQKDRKLKSPNYAKYDAKLR